MPQAQKNKNIIIGSAVVLSMAFIYGGYRFYLVAEALKATKVELTNTTVNLESVIASVKSENKVLSEALQTEQYKNSLFSGQIKEIASTVGALDKLSKTDKELLQKYSKVYFLNEHYVPENLATITSAYVYEKTRTQKIHAKVWPFLERMMKDAEEAGMDFKIVSAYRSFWDQSILKGNYAVTYGTGANKFSADQGYSEHQLGTAIDFTTPDLGAGFTAFAKAPQYKWLLLNAYKYGFTLSYPEDNDYYQFEPWHWRFVGVKLALRLQNEKENFYDVSQRTIDNYLINIFDI